MKLFLKLQDLEQKYFASYVYGIVCTLKRNHTKTKYKQNLELVFLGM